MANKKKVPALSESKDEELLKSLTTDDADVKLLDDVFSNKKDKELAAKLLVPLTARIADNMRTKMEAEYARKLTIEVSAINESNKKMIEEKFMELEKAAQPPTTQDLEKLLSQEYLSVKLTLQKNPKESIEFVLRELPQSAEEKLLKVIREKILPKISEYSAMQMSNVDASPRDKIAKLLDIMPDGLRIFSDLVAVCLDPFEEHKNWLTGEWVFNNLSSNRVIQIIQAQLEVGRMRDFLSGVYRLVNGSGLTT